MYLAYFDETGDDGYPQRTTDLFILTSGYIHDANWQNNYKQTNLFRQYLRTTYSLPVKIELHTKYLLTNKKPYRSFGWSDDTRLKIYRTMPTLSLQPILNL